MWSRLIATLRPSDPEPPRPELEDVDDLMRALLSEPSAPEQPAKPSYLEATPVPAEDRPYLELSAKELRRRAMPPEIARGPSVGRGATGRAVDLAERVLLSPFRLVLDNLGLLFTVFAVMVALMVGAWVLREAVAHYFGHLAG